MEQFGSSLATASPRPSGERARARGAKSPIVGVVRARQLRRNETDAERKLRNALRGRRFYDLKFIRQLPIVCRERMLIVEADGGQHADSAVDAARAAFLNRRGYAVLRFWNNEILQNLDGCLMALDAVLRGDPSPDWRYAPATLSPEGRGQEPATSVRTE